MFPKAKIQNCIIHQLRNSSKYAERDIWADTGDVNVTYRADPILVYDKLKDLTEGTDFDVESAAVTMETHTITLINTEKYPFNSTMDNPVAVALNTTRKNLYYTVEVEVTEHTGDVGEIFYAEGSQRSENLSPDFGQCAKGQAIHLSACDGCVH